MANVKINGVTYNGIFTVNLKGSADDGTTAVNRYVFVSGDPGSLEKEQSFVCINNICYTEKIGIVKIPLADGSGNYSMFLRASETYDRTYRIAPGETIAQGDFVKLIPLYPRGLFTRMTTCIRIKERCSKGWAVTLRAPSALRWRVEVPEQG